MVIEGEGLVIWGRSADLAQKISRKFFDGRRNWALSRSNRTGPGGIRREELCKRGSADEPINQELGLAPVGS